MEAEDVVLQGVESVAANQAEVGYVLLHFTPIGHAVILTAAKLKLHPAHVPVFVDAVSKARVTGAKYGPKDAITGNLPAVTAWTQSISMTVRAGRLCERNCL